MTPRPLARTRRAALLLGAAGLGLAALVGCDPREAMYFLQPFTPKIAAPVPSMKGKKVVVLTYAAPGTLSDAPTLDRDLTTRLVKALRENVKKIDVVAPDKVSAWAQAHPTTTDPAEAARAFEADVVIALEITAFEIQNPSSPGLFEGKSSIHVKVTELAHPKDSRGRPMTDRPKESNVLYDEDCESNYPVTGSIPASADVTRSGFRNKFLGIVSGDLSRLFLDHEAGDDIQDTRFGQP
jgi:hypothetical protein